MTTKSENMSSQIALNTQQAYITFVNFERYKEMLLTIKLNTNGAYDVVIGLHRGGSVPAIHLSHKLEIPCISIDWSIVDGELTERSLADAQLLSRLVHVEKKKVLIVDDIIDSGKTIQELLARSNIDRNSVGIACLIYNDEQPIVPDTWGRKISRTITPDWFEFWWEF